MRSDMKHVIIDRPRLGGYPGDGTPKGYDRRWQRVPLEDLPKSESTSRGRRAIGKTLNEHLAPLRRWLHRQCGRSWDDVYAELCAELRVTNATQAHVRDHAEEFVLRHTRWIAGVVCDSAGVPLPESRHGAHFYVDPRNGKLRAAPARRRWRWQPPAPAFVEGDTWRSQFRLLNGLWFEVVFAWFPRHVGFGVRDVLAGRDRLPPYSRNVRGFTEEEARRVYGWSVYARSKRQLGKQEIRRRKLWDTPLGRRARGLEVE